MKKSCLVAAVLLSIGSGCLMPQEAGANYYWDKNNNEWSEAYDSSVASPSGNSAKLPVEGFTVSAWDHFYAGYSNGNDEVSNNSINVGNVEAEYVSIFGGYSENGNVIGNEVVITDGKNYYSVYGGYSDSYDSSTFAKGNKVTISGANTGFDLVTGGSAMSASSTGNEVIIDAGTGRTVYGGNSENSTTGNIATINGGSISMYIVGGRTQFGSATSNVVNINAGTVQDVYGGMAISIDTETGAAENNYVTWRDGEIKGNVYGSVIKNVSTYIPVKNNGGTFNVHKNIDGSSKELAEGKLGGFDYMNFYLDNGEKLDNPIVTAKEVILADTPKFGLVVSNGTALTNGAKISLLKAEEGLAGTFKPENNYYINAFGLEEKFGFEEGYMQIYASEISSIQSENNILSITYKEDPNINRIIFGSPDGAGYGRVMETGKEIFNGIKASDQKLNLKKNSFNFYTAVGGLGWGIEDVTGNTVTIDGTTVGKENGPESISIDGESKTFYNGDVYGGLEFAGYSDVNNNTVIITDSKIRGSVYGGKKHLGNGDLKNNTVIIKDSDVIGNVYGGKKVDAANGDISNNTVTIAGNTNIGGNVYGGDTVNYYANENTINILGGNIEGNVIGGSAYDGEAYNNIVNWKDGTIKGNIYGGTHLGVPYPDDDGGVFNVYHNDNSDPKTIAEGKTFAGFEYMNFYTNNPVIPVLSIDVVPSYIPDFGAAVKNNVALKPGDTIKLMQANKDFSSDYLIDYYKTNTIDAEGYMPIYKSEISSIQIENNVITLTYKGFDESLDRVIFGGEEGTGYVKVAGDSLDNLKANDQKLNLDADSRNYFAAVGGFSKDEDVSGNKVTIDGATVGKEDGASTTEIAGASFGNGDVYGGYALDASKTASDNEVTWKSGDIKGNIYGGYVAGTAVSGEGNTLNIYHSSGSTSKTIYADKSIAGFDTMNFYLSGDVKANSIIIDNSKANAVKMDGVTVSLENDPEKTLDSDFVKGDKIYLIKNTEGSITPATTELTANGLKYDFEVSTQDNALIATSLNDKPSGANEETKALLEGHAAAALAVNQMVDNTINVALKDAELAASENADGNSTNNNFNAFISANYNKDRISTGSYVDVKGLSGTIGIARKLNNKSGALTYGLFLEGGKNKFDTSNDFASGSVHGKGDANSFGGGLFAKQKNANGMYVEGSLRVGRVNHDFEGFVAKQKAEYDAKSTYYGAHIGLGKLIASGKGEWDVYGKLIYTHINGATANVYDGSELELDAMNSTRLRVGGRYNVNPAPKAVGYYAGLAYEYEFGGQADGKLQGFGLEAPTSKGSTGILELGAKFQPTQNFGIDLGVEGHAGKRRGVGGNVNFRWNF